MAIAHPSKKTGKAHQLVIEHLSNVSQLAADLAEKFGHRRAGAIIGLLHDFGKYSAVFQAYMQLIIDEQSGHFNPDADGITSRSLKGTIDHSTAGAQWLLKTLSPFLGQLFAGDKELKELGAICIQSLFLCIASHHSGLIDNLPDPLSGYGGFKNRNLKAEDESHLNECCENADREVYAQAEALATPGFLYEQAERLRAMLKQDALSEIEKAFYLGMHTKLLFSCLIDADRIDSADYETPEKAEHRHQQAGWALLCDRLESRIAGFARKEKPDPIDPIRASISDNCLKKADEAQGIFSLTVPTGGGKTLASLRFALNHAKKHRLDRIIYIIPYTSIIEQNADAIRTALDLQGEENNWVLEHHSNLEPEVLTWRSKLAAENWDTPIVLTTMVQFLETLFGSGTRGVRRLHQLANAVLIFDEIQTLPVRCVHLFNNAVNYLHRHCNTTAVMCTATQPLLHRLPADVVVKGQLALSEINELTPDISTLYQQLERVNVKDFRRTGGWKPDQLAELVEQQMQTHKSCLVIVNTKNWARRLYQSVKVSFSEDDKTKIFHLSTLQCPSHRKSSLDEIRTRLKQGLPTVCISTSLIEAGVDISAMCAIRFVAGLDSIMQAAGRCNRHGELEGKGEFIVLNPDKENLGKLKEIEKGIEISKRIFDEADRVSNEKRYPPGRWLSPEAITRYFEYYFYQRKDEMSYPIQTKLTTNGKDSLLNLLSTNSGIDENKLPMRHAFMQAAKAFKAIDAPTHAVIVPFNDEAKTIIDALMELDKRFDAKRYRELLRSAQKYSVNLYPNDWQKLLAQEAVYPIAEDEAVFCLLHEYYSQEFGVSTEVVGMREFYGV